MRHRVAGKLYNVDKDHRKALLKNLADELVVHGEVKTTLAKARALRPYIEKLVTKAKNDSSFTSVKRVNVKLSTKEASKKLFMEVAPLFKDRKGGYTRIVRTGNRDGDNAEMARIEFVEKPSKKATKKPRKTEVKEKETK